jgi:septal ring factor EnvC (AmiA/AmiB activator)
MTDDPENHTLRLLREMREENAAFRAEVNARFEQVDRRFEQVDRRFDEMQGQFATVLQTVVDIAKAVNIVHEDVAELRVGQKIVETELRGLRGRVERVEDKLERAKV